AVFAGKASGGSAWNCSSSPLISSTIGQSRRRMRSLALPKMRVRKLGMGKSALSAWARERSSYRAPRGPRRHGVRYLARSRLRGGELRPQPRMPRIDRQPAPERLRRLRTTAARHQHDAEVVVRLGMVGVDRGRLAELGDRLVPACGLEIRGAEVVVHPGDRVRAAPRATENVRVVADRIVVPAELEEHVADVVERALVKRIDLE